MFPFEREVYSVKKKKERKVCELSRLLEGDLGRPGGLSCACELCSV